MMAAVVTFWNRAENQLKRRAMNQFLFFKGPSNVAIAYTSDTSERATALANWKRKTWVNMPGFRKIIMQGQQHPSHLFVTVNLKEHLRALQWLKVSASATLTRCGAFAILALLSVTPALPQFGNATRLQQLPIQPGLTCANLQVPTWIAAHGQFECAAGGAGGVVVSGTPSVGWEIVATSASTATWQAVQAANGHCTMSATTSCTITGLTGVVSKAVVSCYDNSGTLAVIIPNDFAGSTADTLVINFSAAQTGYCNASTGVGATGASSPPASPTASVQFNAGAGAFGGTAAFTWDTTNGITVTDASGTFTLLGLTKSAGTSTGVRQTWQTSRGTTASPTISTSGDNIVDWQFQGRGSAGYGTAGGILARVIGTPGTTHVGGSVAMYALDTAGALKSEVGVEQDGTISLNNITSSNGLNPLADGSLEINDGTAGSVKPLTLTFTHYNNAAEPTCNSTNRGDVVLVTGGAGVADTFRICTKDSGDAYAYRALF